MGNGKFLLLRELGKRALRLGTEKERIVPKSFVSRFLVQNKARRVCFQANFDARNRVAFRRNFMVAFVVKPSRIPQFGRLTEARDVFVLDDA